MTAGPRLVWNRLERTLRTEPERLVCHFDEIDGAVFAELWRRRGQWTAETELARALDLGLGAVTRGIRHIRREAEIFSLFVVSRGQAPSDFRLVLDHFELESRVSTVSPSVDCAGLAGTSRLDRHAAPQPSSSEVETCGDSSAAAPVFSFSELRRIGAGMGVGRG